MKEKIKAQAIENINEDPTIYNCHVHVFTNQHAPENFLMMDPRINSVWLSRLLMSIVRRDKLSRWFIKQINRIGRFITFLTGESSMFNELATTFERGRCLFVAGNKLEQKEVLRKIAGQYPPKTKFIVLPMNMHHMGLGIVPTSIDQQHTVLEDLATHSEFADQIISFFAVDPREDDIFRKVETAFSGEETIFKGVKIYPSLGHMPDDHRLMRIYAFCECKGIPVMAHCSTGGVWQKGFGKPDRRCHNRPENYRLILESFPKLRLCLAHFGGAEEWRKHITREKDPCDESQQAWVRTIANMIRSGNYPNLYTDISYTVFEEPERNANRFDFIDYLNVLLENQRIRERTLFGSDYYMVEQEDISEREVSILLRSRLGRDLFFQIAHTNPIEFLGTIDGAKACAFEYE
ncbi:MAG: amidohydrolase family protein [Chloroflexota bacterium]